MTGNEIVLHQKQKLDTPPESLLPPSETPPVPDAGTQGQKP
jgi:hypothetical protein